MGMLSYALMGAVKGGADTYKEIRTEERKDDKLQQREKREQDIWLVRQERLAQYRATETASDREWQEERDYNKQAIVSEQAALDRDFKREEGMLSRKADAEKPISVSSGTAVFDPSSGKEIYKNEKAGDVGGKEGKNNFNRKDASKYFSRLAKSSFGGSDFEALSKENSIMATRAASIAMKLWDANDEGIDANTIWSKAHQIVADNPTIKEDEINLMVEDSKKQSGWWRNAEDKKRIAATESKANDLRANRWDTSIPSQETVKSASRFKVKPTANDLSSPENMRAYLTKQTDLSFGQIEQTINAKFGSGENGRTMPESPKPAYEKPNRAGLMGLANVKQSKEPSYVPSATNSTGAIVNVVEGKNLADWQNILKQATRQGGRSSAAVIKQARRNIAILTEYVR